jgi:hypothetical protein
LRTEIDSMTFRSVCLATLVLCVAPCFSLAQTKERIAFTNVDDAGEDYLFQGEYRGQVEGEGFVGLQVIAKGLGEFAAVGYPGGLPGTGWNQTEKSLYTGGKLGDAVRLADANSEIEVTSGRAWVRRDGRRVGELTRVVRVSPTMGLVPAFGSDVLFDGEPNGLADAKVDEGLLDVGFSTEKKVGDFRLHVEFKTPFMPNSSGQARGNSGIYIQRRYEVQVLDSFGLEGVENECGGLYKQKRPDVNMCLPPLQWQTYDIFFRAARFADGVKSESARITVVHNGVPIHNDYEIKNKTGAGKKESDSPGEILFQNHRDPVRYRNIWLVNIDGKPRPLAGAPSTIEPFFCPTVAQPNCKAARRLFRCR